MQDFDFCPNLIKFYHIYPNATNFSPNLQGDALASPTPMSLLDCNVT